MQDHPLTLQMILERMRTISGDSEVVTLTDEGPVRASYAEVADRADRLAAALAHLGVGQSDRVATFMWTSQQHLEVYLAAPCMGAVLHTLNIRLFPEQLTYIVNHARDKVIVVDDSLIPVLAPLVESFEHVEHYIVVGDGDASALPNALRYEELLDREGLGFRFEWPRLDERQAAGLCYTSGTTGNPKGVLYSHRSNILHCLATCMAETIGITSADRVLPVVPMFHVNAWGFPYAAALVGADLVMPGRFLQGEPLAKLIESERVTFAGGVPTIWLDVLRYADEHKPDFSCVRKMICGGAAVPEKLMRDFQERHGVRIIQAWGMTETSPIGSVANAPRAVTGEDEWAYRTASGRIVPLVEARLIGEDGAELPWDGEATGELEVRGPWIAADYYEDPSSPEKFHHGWLRTGDVASIDAHGYIRITDRAKDLIKSGGEWISSVELENALMAHPNVRECAVIAMPDERWTERPLACVVRESEERCDEDELRTYLEQRVAKWWVPDRFAFIDEVPKTSVGKFDKKVLRSRLAEGELS
jgi:fatty-acyl-CoA synthase